MALAENLEPGLHGAVASGLRQTERPALATAPYAVADPRVGDERRWSQGLAPSRIEGGTAVAKLCATQLVICASRTVARLRFSACLGGAAAKRPLTDLVRVNSFLSLTCSTAAVRGGGLVGHIHLRRLHASCFAGPADDDRCLG